MLRGDILRLFITAPPRHWKSSLVSEKFLLWFLSRFPRKAVISCGNAVSLVEKFSRNIRDSIQSNEHLHELFPGVRVREDAAGVSDWSLTSAWRSSFRAVGIGGSILGVGADLMVIDDPLTDQMEAFSKVQRDKIFDHYQTVLRPRLEPGGAIVLIMSRWDSDDLAGRLLSMSDNGTGEKFERLHLPALNDKGEALWPERWPKSALDDVRLAIGSRAWSAQYMGSPRPQEGNILDSRKLRQCLPHQVPPLLRHVRRWDLAFSDKQGADFVAGALLGIAEDGHIYILDMKRLKGRWTSSKPVIVQTALDDGPEVVCAIEANGTQLGYYQDIQADPRMGARVVIADKPEGSKEMRASMWGSRLDDGIIHCVTSTWRELLFDEMDSFPYSAKDDMVDAVSGAYLLLVGGGSNIIPTLI